MGGMLLAQCQDFLVHIHAEGGGHPAGLSYHEHRFRKGSEIGLLQAAELFWTHVQLLGKLLETQACFHSCLVKGCPQVLKNVVGFSGHGISWNLMTGVDVGPE